MKNRSTHFKNIEHTEDLASLKEAWHKSLTAPQDGMWESFMENAAHWSFIKEGQNIGYACVNPEGDLIQFFVLAEWRHESTAVFSTFIQQESIHKAMVGTNNPVFLSTALHFQQSIGIDSYFFTEYIDTKITHKEGVLKEAKQQNLEAVVDFCHLSTGGPKEWLEGYVQNLIERKEIFIFRNDKDIIGTCEVRKSPYGQAVSNPKVADIGMIVSPFYRKQGYGTFLLGKAKEMAIQNGRRPICSCEKDNTGSLKAIQANGFRSAFLLLSIEVSVGVV